jgi:hypothetical protein
MFSLNRCPDCGKDLWFKPSEVFGDIRCPHCGCLLWFVFLNADVRLSKHAEVESIRERVIEGLAEVLKVDKEKIRLDPSLKFLGTEYGVDSLDIVEKNYWSLKKNYDNHASNGTAELPLALREIIHARLDREIAPR